VSRHVVDLLNADAKIRRGRYVFECPMAVGYPKWVQIMPDMENPYLGAQCRPRPLQA